MKLSTAISGSGADSVLTVKVHSYVYQTDGSEIAMGAVDTQFMLDVKSGPSAGGNAVTITLDNTNQDITSVTVGGAAAAITGQTATNVTLTMPAGTEGARDVVIASTSAGTIRLLNAYTYNPVGVIWDPKIAAGGPYIVAGHSHNLAIKADGSLAVWGFNSQGQANMPVGNHDFVAVAAADSHSLGLKADGAIIAWGGNSYNQTSVPAPNADFVDVACAGNHSLGLKEDGTIVAWGYNYFGQGEVPAPNSDFVTISAGFWHSLGLKANGTIVAWGRNNDGQTTVPEPNSDFVAISAGRFHSLGLKADGTVVAWGDSSSRQTTVPEPNSDFVAIAAGGFHSLGLKADGTIVAWGNNSKGQLSVPSPNADFMAVAAGETHSLGLKSDGAIVAWGNNEYGQVETPVPNAGFGRFAYAVSPHHGWAGGGYEVVINGTNLCNGTIGDLTSVTLCGVPAEIVSASGTTQIVVRAAASQVIGIGDVVVVSTSHGTTTKSDAFTYYGEPAPDPTAPSVIQNISTHADGSVQIVFETVPGANYTVQYCDVLGGVWKSINTFITATESVTLWIDSGLPATDSHPADVPTRFYRILTNQEIQ